MLFEHTTDEPKGGIRSMLFVVLPAYNEAGALPLLVADIEETCRHLQHRIIAVDDGSSDDTGEVLHSLKREYVNFDFVQHEENKGLGEALLSGFQTVIKSRDMHSDDPKSFRSNFFYEVGEVGTLPDIVVTMDADNTHPAECIPALVAKIGEGADLAIASRYVSGAKQTGLAAFRRLLSWGAGAVMHVFFPISGVRDYSCGYRAYRLSILEKGLTLYGQNLIESRNFAGMVELLLKITPFCRRIAEIPLDLHYERKQGLSKMKILATIWGYLYLIYRLKRKNWGSLEWAGE
ncbi:glycosyltransferase family 2 protein [Paradesulfitobacterium aromaticivorans]